MHLKKKKSYTLMIIPGGEGKTIHFRLNIWWLRISAFLFFVIVIGSVFLFFYMATIGVKLQQTYLLIRENEKLTKDNEKLRSIATKMKLMEQTSVYLRRLALSLGENAVDSSLSKIAGNFQETIYNEDSLEALVSRSKKNTTDTILRELKDVSLSRDDIYKSLPNISPVDGWITNAFTKDSTENTSMHLGVDLAAKRGTPIRATAPGEVIEVVNDTYFGLMVVLKHKIGYVTKYGHCMQILVSKSDYVERGQAIALVGSTGLSTAPHVHYEIVKDGKNIDPLKYMFDQAH